MLYCIWDELEHDGDILNESESNWVKFEYS